MFHISITNVALPIIILFKGTPLLTISFTKDFMFSPDSAKVSTCSGTSGVISYLSNQT